LAITGAAPALAAAAQAAPAAAQVADFMPPEATTTDSAKTATKPKKRKVAHRRKPRDHQGPAYAYGHPAANPYASQSYAGYQPFFGYGRW